MLVNQAPKPTVGAKCINVNTEANCLHTTLNLKFDEPECMTLERAFRLSVDVNLCNQFHVYS